MSMTTTCVGFFFFFVNQVRDDHSVIFKLIESIYYRFFFQSYKTSLESTTGSHVPHKSLTQSHAIFTPEAA